MPEQWIDQHVGTEVEARQTFRAEVRSTLRDAWDGETVTTANVVTSPKQPRRWVRAAVAGGLVAASVVAGLIVIRRDSSPTTVDTSPASIVESTTPVEVGSALREAIVDSRWAIVAVNGEAPTSHYVPWFSLSNDGVLVETRWSVVADVEIDTLGIGTRFWDLGGDVVVTGPSDDLYHQQFIGLLSADGPSQVFDSMGWQVIGIHDGAGLLARVATDGLQIARFPAASPLDLAQSAVYGVQPATPAALAVEPITAQLGSPDIDTDAKLFVGCGESGDIPRRWFGGPI